MSLRYTNKVSIQMDFPVEVPEVRKTAACGEWKERKTARLPGQRVRLPRDGFPHDECEMPGLP